MTSKQQKEKVQRWSQAWEESSIPSYPFFCWRAPLTLCFRVTTLWETQLIIVFLGPRTRVIGISAYSSRKGLITDHALPLLYFDYLYHQYASKQEKSIVRAGTWNQLLCFSHAMSYVPIPYFLLYWDSIVWYTDLLLTYFLKAKGKLND